MDIKQLKSLIGQMQKSFAVAGVKSTAKDIKKFADALPGGDNTSADDVLRTLRTELNSNPGKTAPKGGNSGAGRGRSGSSTDDIVVENYVHQLVAAGLDSSTFDRIFNSLISDRAAKKAEVDAIAHKYVKGPAKYPTKAKAQNAIRARHTELVRSENEIKYLDRKKVTPW